MGVATKNPSESNILTLFLDFFHEWRLVSQFTGSFSPVAVLKDGSEVDLDKRLRNFYQGSREEKIHGYEIDYIYCGKMAYGYI